jgi:YbbR domain-containing protein
MQASLTQNWLLKLLSLIFALVLWFFVMGEQNLEVGYAVPLELKNVPSGMMVANDVPSLVDVRISGPRTVLVNLKPSDISLTVDLAGLQPGVTSFKRLEERLNLPNPLKVTRLSPSFVDIKLERIKDRTVPVRAVFAGTLPDGFRIDKIEIRPRQVLVEGAEGELKEISEVTTEPIDVSAVSENFTLMVPLDHRGKFTTLKEQRAVEVRVVIAGRAPAAPEPKAEKATP